MTVCDGRGRAVAAAGLVRWLARVAPRRFAGRVAIALVADRTMRRFNREYRGLDHPTDVLSFPVDAGWRDGRRAAKAPRTGGDVPLLGDIAIATGVARRQARLHGHTYGTELRVLALHGLLHLVGYDHERDAGAMGMVEARLRRAGGLPAGLTERGRRP
ncbi:MAG: rRNA maturation RNase YbeY [Vicinamibacterales bacterium]